MSLRIALKPRSQVVFGLSIRWISLKGFQTLFIGFLVGVTDKAIPESCFGRVDFYSQKIGQIVVFGSFSL
jgi:hypothetical protein